jgi:hypothetical protein
MFRSPTGMVSRLARAVWDWAKSAAVIVKSVDSVEVIAGGHPLVS